MRFGKRWEFFSKSVEKRKWRSTAMQPPYRDFENRYFQMALNSSMTSRARDIALLTFYHYHFIIIIELVPHKSRFPKMFGSRPKWFCRFSFPPRFRIQFLLAVCLFRRSLIYRVFRSKSIRKGEGKSKRILFKASRYYPPLLSCKITSRL